MPRAVLKTMNTTTTLAKWLNHGAMCVVSARIGTSEPRTSGAASNSMMTSTTTMVL